MHNCCDHDVAAEDYNLMLQIDHEHIRCLNTENELDAPKIFRPFHHRLDQDPLLKSDADEQLILFIPFTSQLKLKSISIKGPGSHAPSHLKAYLVLI